MALSIWTEKGLEDDRKRRARNKVDLTMPGALDALIELDKSDASPDAFEDLAAKFPITFHRGIKPPSRAAHSRALAFLQKRGDKAALSIKTGADISHEDPPRLSTGSLAMDFVLNGGIPRGMITQFKGAESLGKTFCAMKTASETLSAGGTVLWCAAERFNKSWARTCGIPIPFSVEELRNTDDPDHRALMEKYNADSVDGERFSLLVGRNGNELLQTIVEAVEHNVFDLIVLDSIAVLRRALVLDKKSVGDETMGGEAKLFNDFCTRLESAFNFVESRHGKVIGTVYTCKNCGESYDKKTPLPKCSAKAKGKCSLSAEHDYGEALRSALLVLNQIRDRGIGSYIPQRPDAPGGRGLRHAKGVEIEFQSGEALSTEYQGRSVSYGKRSIFTCTKSKVGAPNRTAAVEIHYQTIPGLATAGDYNLWVDLFGCKFRGDRKIVGLAEMAGIMVQKGAHIYVGDERFHGQNALFKYLSDPKNTHVVQALRVTISKWILDGGF